MVVAISVEKRRKNESSHDGKCRRRQWNSLDPFFVSAVMKFGKQRRNRTQTCPAGFLVLLLEVPDVSQFDYLQYNTIPVKSQSAAHAAPMHDCAFIK